MDLPPWMAVALWLLSWLKEKLSVQGHISLQSGHIQSPMCVCVCASNGWLLALIPDDSDDLFICRAPRGFGWGPCAPESLSLPEPVSIPLALPNPFMPMALSGENPAY